jgi:hypothetical protein
VQKAMPYYSADQVFSYGTEDGSTRTEMLTGIGVIGIWVVIFIAFLPIAALALTFALVTKSNAAGIALGVVYAFVEPIVFALLGALSDVFDSVQKAMPYYSADQVFSIEVTPASECVVAPAG